jgi:hypothetical protein
MAVYSMERIRAQAQRAAREQGAKAQNPFPLLHPAHAAFAQQLAEALDRGRVTAEVEAVAS